MIYTQPHSNIPNVHHFKVQFEKSVRVSVISRHFHGFRNPKISQDIPSFNFRSPNDVLQTILDLSQVDPDPMQNCPKIGPPWSLSLPPP